MAGQKVVREPKGSDLFPRNSAKAHIYDSAKQLLQEAERGEVKSLTLMWDREDLDARLHLLGNDPGIHIQNAGIMVSRVFAALNDDDLDDASPDEKGEMPS